MSLCTTVLHPGKPVEGSNSPSVGIPDACIYESQLENLRSDEKATIPGLIQTKEERRKGVKKQQADLQLRHVSGTEKTRNAGNI